MRPSIASAVTGSLLALAAAPAFGAGPACHCFRDRDFDPGRPAASDPYVLATTANSLLAAVSGTPKRAIVQARMSGVSGDELWIAAHVASRLGRLGVSWTELDALAAAGAELQQTILASVMGLWSGRPPAQVFADATTGTGSWSGALAALGRTPAQMESEIARMLSGPGP